MYTDVYAACENEDFITADIKITRFFKVLQK